MTERKQVPKPFIGKNTVTPMDVFAKIVYWVLWGVLIIYALSMLVLPLYMLLTSLKADNLECLYNPFGLPAKLNWSNFSEIFVIFDEKLEVSVGSMFAVSILTSVLKPLLGTFFTACFAYVEAKYEFIGRRFFFALGIIIMILPIVGSMPSAMQIIYNSQYHLSGTSSVYRAQLLAQYILAQLAKEK